jgi:hypothetical protein
MSMNPAYEIWCGMRRRCCSPKSKDYPNYGGRGIRVCGRWSSFDAFLEDMGERPSKGHSVDRIDNNGDYAPENCRWATPKMQADNRDFGVKVTVNGVTYKSIAGACKALGLSNNTIRHRMWRRGMSAEQALDAPVIKGRCNRRLPPPINPHRR